VATTTFVKSLKALVRQRQALQQKERQLAEQQRQLLSDLGPVLERAGYRLTPIGAQPPGPARRNGSGPGGARKRFKCPKCDRRFAHPLPMARHTTAAHGSKPARKAAPKSPKARKAS
jgi:uncharacterized C2H2 Zn-finger protein